MDADQLRELALRAADDPTTLDGLTEDEITAMRRAINPAGGIVSTKGAWANMSVINFTEQSRRNFLMMAFIGFAYRLAAEYEPEPVEINAKWNPIIESTTGEERKRNIARRDGDIKAYYEAQRRAVTAFLDRNFEYNPDLHVRKAKSKGFSDSERQAAQEAIRRDIAADRLKEATDILKDTESAFTKLKTVVERSYKELSLARADINACIRAVADPQNDPSDKIAILAKRGANIGKLTENLGKVARPLAAADTAHAIRVEPPADVFHQFTRYMDNHYEVLNDICLGYFNEKPDLEEMVILYSVHNNENDAKEYCRQHNREFRTQVITVGTGGATILGPYKANRERYDYYNQNTEVLRALTEQAEADAKLGKDMLEKQVQRKKAKNIREDGPDKPGLGAYRNAGIVGTVVNGEIKGAHVGEDGAVKVIPNDKMQELEAKIAAEKAAAPASAASAAALAPAASAAALAASSSAASSSASSSASSPPMGDASDDVVRPVMTELAKRTHIFNVESYYHEKPPVDDYDAARQSGTYRVNDTPTEGLPDNAVHMQMFVPVTDPETGESKLVQRDFYTRAEPPLHLERDSPYADKYQPIGTSGDLVEQKVVDVTTGRESIVHVVRQS